MRGSPAPGPGRDVHLYGYTPRLPLAGRTGQSGAFARVARRPLGLLAAVGAAPRGLVALPRAPPDVTDPYANPLRALDRPTLVVWEPLTRICRVTRPSASARRSCRRASNSCKALCTGPSSRSPR